jgi:hypothetical protein
VTAWVRSVGRDAPIRTLAAFGLPREPGGERFSGGSGGAHETALGLQEVQDLLVLQAKVSRGELVGVADPQTDAGQVRRIAWLVREGHGFSFLPCRPQKREKPGAPYGRTGLAWWRWPATA